MQRANLPDIGGMWGVDTGEMGLTYFNTFFYSPFLFLFNGSDGMVAVGENKEAACEGDAVYEAGGTLKKWACRLGHL